MAFRCHLRHPCNFLGSLCPPRYFIPVLVLYFATEGGFKGDLAAMIFFSCYPVSVWQRFGHCFSCLVDVSILPGCFCVCIALLGAKYVGFRVV